MKALFAKHILLEERQLLNNLDIKQLFKTGMLLKKDPFSEARLLTVGDKAFFIKFYKDKGWVGKVKKMLRLSRGWKVFSISQSVYEKVPFLPRPLAYINIHTGAFYVTEGFADTVDLRAFEHSDGEIIKRHSIVTQVAFLLADLHNAGFSHGDMKFGNVLFCQSDNSLRLVDWDGCRQTTNQKYYQRDVARFIVALRESGLDVSLESVFLKNYLAKIKVKGNKEKIDLWVKEFESRHREKEHE